MTRYGTSFNAFYFLFPTTTKGILLLKMVKYSSFSHRIIINIIRWYVKGKVKKLVLFKFKLSVLQAITIRLVYLKIKLDVAS
jgi:hypothetical protein